MSFDHCLYKYYEMSLYHSRYKYYDMSLYHSQQGLLWIDTSTDFLSVCHDGQKALRQELTLQSTGGAMV